MKKSRILMFVGLIIILLIPFMFWVMNSTIIHLDDKNLDMDECISASETKIVSNITLILNYHDGDNVTFYDITLIDDISPYNATVVSLGEENISEYWAINGVFIRGLCINETWYTNGAGGRNWLYYVNGELPGVSSSVFELNNDSVVEWKFKSGSPYEGNDINDDFWIYLGLFLGIAAGCVIGIALILKKGF